jgi:hypothetical protein
MAVDGSHRAVTRQARSLHLTVVSCDAHRRLTARPAWEARRKQPRSFRPMNATLLRFQRWSPLSRRTPNRFPCDLGTRGSRRKAASESSRASPAFPPQQAHLGAYPGCFVAVRARTGSRVSSELSPPQANFPERVGHVHLRHRVRRRRPAPRAENRPNGSSPVGQGGLPQPWRESTVLLCLPKAPFTLDASRATAIR